MFTFIRNRLDVKIILSLSFVIACMICVYTYIDIRNMQLDTIRTSERTSGAFAAAIKGSVNASMKTGLKEAVCGTDIIARSGGEEFAVVTPDTDLEGDVHKADALRWKTEAMGFPGADTTNHMTISIDMATYASGSPSGLINAADQALYRAKHSGRNKVVMSRPEMVVTEL